MNKKRSHNSAPQSEGPDAKEMLNKYGTYNIQPTADTENLFPQISAGLPRKNKQSKKSP